ncbi:MAG TPA: hypothetical protein VNE59_01375 [Burkholderiales bacterium]|nr:hypothetical protein [Burkholderiales bacterium]
MNIIMWMLTGGVAGWVGFALLGYNEQRGMVVSIIIGLAGGIIGGKVIAPMFTAAAAVPGNFSLSALLFAAAIATAFLVVGNLVYKRWGV